MKTWATGSAFRGIQAKTQHYDYHLHFHLYIYNIFLCTWGTLHALKKTLYLTHESNKMPQSNVAGIQCFVKISLRFHPYLSSHCARSSRAKGIAGPYKQIESQILVPWRWIFCWLPVNKLFFYKQLSVVNKFYSASILICKVSDRGTWVA